MESYAAQEDRVGGNTEMTQTHTLRYHTSYVTNPKHEKQNRRSTVGSRETGLFKREGTKR